MQNVWHWGLIPYHVACLVYKYNPVFAKTIEKRLTLIKCSEKWEENLCDFFHKTARKTQANIFALKALGLSYVFCLLHLLEISHFPGYSEEKEFEIKCQLLFTIYACEKIYKDQNLLQVLLDRFSGLTGDFYQKFIQYLNYWLGVDFVNKGHTQEDQLVDFITERIIGQQDYKKELTSIIQNRNRNMFNNINMSGRVLLKTDPGITITKTAFLTSFKAIAGEIINAILTAPLPGKTNHTFNDLIHFKDKDNNYLKKIRELIIRGVPIHNKHYDSCHYLAGTIMAYDYLVNGSRYINKIKRILAQTGNEVLVEHINNLMPDVKKIEQSEDIKELLDDEENHMNLISALKEISVRLEWIRIAFYHSSLDVGIDVK